MNVLFFLHPGTNSRAFFADIIAGFAAAGHATFVWEIGPALQVLREQPQNTPIIRQKLAEEIASFIRTRNIDLSVGLWANAIKVTDNELIGGRSVTLFERIRSPHLMIWYDAPDRAFQNSLRGTFKEQFFKSDCLFHYINNPATAREMRAVYNFGNIIARSYGVNPVMFRPIEDAQKDYDLIFCASYGNVDHPTPLMLSELGKDEPDLLALRCEVTRMRGPVIATLAELFPTQLRDPGLVFVQALAKSQLFDRRRPMLDRIVELRDRGGAVGSAAGIALEEPPIYAEIANQIREIEIYERAFVFTYLSRYFKSAVFGKVDYCSLGCTADHFDAVPYDEQAAIYSRGRIGLSVMRWQDEHGLHVKPFEMTACGIACAAAHREGIEESFVESQEFVSFRTLADGRKKIADLLANPSRLAAVARAGRNRTLRDHTWAAWTRDVVSQIKRSANASLRSAA